MMVRSPNFQSEVSLDDDVLTHVLAEYGAGRGIYIGGSPSAGLGTVHSDVDLFLVDMPHETTQVMCRGKRIDIEFQSPEELESIIMDSLEMRSTHLEVEQLNRATRSRLDIVVRFLYGQIIQDPVGRLAELKSVILANEDGLRRLLVARHCLDAMNTFEDALGASQFGDDASASHLEREAFLLACEALLASKGDLYIGTKWVWRKWARTLSSDIDDHISELLVDGGARSSEFGRFTSSIQSLLVMAATGSIFTSGTVPVRTDTLRMKSTVIPVPMASDVVLFDIGTGASTLSREGALLLGMSNGRTVSEAISLFSGADGGADIPESELEAYVLNLRKRGLLV